MNHDQPPPPNTFKLPLVTLSFDYGGEQPLVLDVLDAILMVDDSTLNKDRPDTSNPGMFFPYGTAEQTRLLKEKLLEFYQNAELTSNQIQLLIKYVRESYKRYEADFDLGSKSLPSSETSE